MSSAFVERIVLSAMSLKPVGRWRCITASAMAFAKSSWQMETNL